MHQAAPHQNERFRVPSRLSEQRGDLRNVIARVQCELCVALNNPSCTTEGINNIYTREHRRSRGRARKTRREREREQGRGSGGNEVEEERREREERESAEEEACHITSTTYTP